MPGGEDSSTFRTGVLMFSFGVGEIIWGLIFLVCHCPSHFLSIKVYFRTGQLIIWGLSKSWSDY